MSAPGVTPSPGFISIAVRDVARSAAFYERFLGAIRDPFDFGPTAVSFVGWPTFAINSNRAPNAEATTIQLWWRAADPDAVAVAASEAGVPILQEPFDGPFGRTFAMADPDGYRVTVYQRDQPLFWPPRSAP